MKKIVGVMIAVGGCIAAEYFRIGILPAIFVGAISGHIGARLWISGEEDACQQKATETL